MFGKELGAVMELLSWLVPIVVILLCVGIIWSLLGILKFLCVLGKEVKKWRKG